MTIDQLKFISNGFDDETINEFYYNKIFLMLIMFYIKVNKDTSYSYAISKDTNVPQPTVYKICERLEEHHYLKSINVSTRFKTDRKLYSLTEMGNKLYEKMRTL